MFFIFIIIAIFFIEAKIKSYVEKNKVIGKKEKILNGKVILNKQHNYGAFLNLLEGKKEIIIMISSVLLGALIIIFGLTLPKKRHFLLKMGMSLMLGGAISNLHDRITRGYVVDYFSINKGKKLSRIVFNIADFCIIIGSVLITISSFFIQGFSKQLNDTMGN